MENVYSGRVPVPRQDKLKIAVAFILYFLFGVFVSCMTGHTFWLWSSLFLGALGSYFKSDLSREVEINRRLVLNSIGEDLI